MDRPKFKILRSPSLKRKQRAIPVAERVKLERVLGLTITSNAALSVDRSTGTIAYPAGCVVVLYNPKKGKQSHIFNASKKTLTCLAFSGDGKHLVTGESGHQPAVRVWSLEDNVQVAEFLGHKYGVSCVAFSPNLKYIVSVGTQHDMMVNVWNWKTNIKVASNKVASKVTDVAFSEDGSMFVTVGNRHVKFWYLDASKSKIKTETLPLQGRNGILGEHQNNFFCGVCCGKGQMANTVYAITESGLLCEFDQKRLLVKWVLLRTDRANAVCLGEQHIFIGCASGLVRIFNAKTLNFLATLPHPHHLGVDVSLGLPQNNVLSPDNSRYPDTIAVKYDDMNNRLTCIYNDHSLYVWDVTDIHKVAKTRSFLFHSGAVWGIDVYPDIGASASLLPPGSFVTCSSDNTIRIWNCSPSLPTDTPYKRNIYCNELLKIIYIDPELNNLLDIVYNPAGKTDKTDTSYQEKNGIRSVRFSPNGKHLAAGDRAGNLRVHDLSTMQQLAAVEAHDSEVLCLEFTQPSTGVNLLATASRDRLLHVFDVDHMYGLVQTLDDHSSAITAIKFVQLDGQLQMLSCGADKSLLFRNAQMDPEFRFVLNRHLVSRTTLYDMETDTTGKFVATACQDRNIRIYNTRTGKQKKCYSGSFGSEGTLIKVELDPSGYYAATSCSDKNLSVYDFFSGECVATMFGHFEISPGIKFLNDMKHFVSVSVDGCVFVWRLPSEFTECMMGRIGQEVPLKEMPDNKTQVRRETFVLQNADPVDFPDANRNFPSELPFSSQASPLSNDASPGQFYRFSVGQLPAWAKPRVQPGSYEKPSTLTTNSLNTAMPKGKWARDVEGDPPTTKPLFSKSLLNGENRVFDLPASLALQVSVIDDDEHNRDDEAEDEFSPDRSPAQVFSNPVHSKPKIEREISDNSSNSVEDEDESETNEMPYYMPSANVDSDSAAAESTFMVQENDLKNFRESFGNEFLAPGEEEESELAKSRPCTPTDSTKESDLTSPDGEKSAEETFESFYQCNETFEETLKKLENEITSRFDNQSHLHNSRHSISSRFFDHSQISLPSGQESQSNSLQPIPVPKESSVKFVDEGKKNLNEPRDLRLKEPGSVAAGNARRHGRSLGGEMKSMVKNEPKLDSSVSFATLPKMRGKTSRQSTDSALNALHKPAQVASVQNLLIDTDHGFSTLAAQQKRKPVNRVQSYRMQTESSLAKLTASDSVGSKVTSRRSAPLPQTSKYQSTPNLLTGGDGDSVKVGERDENDIKAADDIRMVKDKILAITKTRQFSPVPEVEIEPRTRSVYLNSSDNSHLNVSSSDALATSLSDFGLDKNANQDLMPPPATTQVPTSMHNAFLTKAAKQRHHGVPEISLSQATNVQLGKGLPLVETAKENFDISPRDLPVRDTDDSNKRLDLKASSPTVRSVATLGKLTMSPAQKSVTMTEVGETVSDESLEPASSPKIVKIGRCISPARPFSSSTSEDRGFGFAHRRVLPADPKVASSVTKEATRNRATSLGSDQILLTLRPETTDMSTNRSTAEDTVAPCSKTPTIVSGVQSSASSHVKSGGRTSPFKMLLSSDGGDSKTTWMKKAQQMQLQWEHRQLKKGSNIVQGTSEPSSASSGIINEIERHCEELRLTGHADLLEKPTRLTSLVETETSEDSDVDLGKEEWIPTGHGVKSGQGSQPFLDCQTISSEANAVSADFTTDATATRTNNSAETVKQLIAFTSSAPKTEIMATSSEHPCAQELELDAAAATSYIPREGEPGAVERILKIPVSEVLNISNVTDLSISFSQQIIVTDKTEDQCAKVASELTEAVTKARQMFTQLSSDSIHSDTTSSHDRALQLLRETICEAKDQLSKTLDTPLMKSAHKQSSEADERMFAMLDSYSQKLYDLFKKKLEND